MSAQLTEDHGPRPASAEAIRLGYEPPHVGLRAMMIGLVIAIVLGAVIFAASWFIEKVMLGMDQAKTAPTSAVQPTPTVSAIPLPPLQPSTLHRTTDREDIHAMHVAEDQVFTHLGWTREAAVSTDPDKATAVVPFHVPDSVLAAVAKRTAGVAPATTRITKESPQPAPTAPATTSGPADGATPPAASAPTTGGAQ